MGAILISLGLSSTAAAAWIVHRLGGTATRAPDGTPTTPVIPPTVVAEITDAELNNNNEAVRTNGGFRRNQRKTKRNR
jgi:L-aminopeptidase/D-esterase-like protein